MAGGRPTVMTPETVGKLEEAFLWGCTDIEASLHAGIHRDTLYAYIEKNPSFSDRKETLKTSPLLRSRRIISDKLDENDAAQANKVIERKEGTKHTIEGDISLKVSSWTVDGVESGG